MTKEKYEQRILKIIDEENLPVQYVSMEKYIGNKTNINFFCKIHNYHYKRSINNFLCRRDGCPKCNKVYHYSFEERLQQVKDRIELEKLPYDIIDDGRERYRNRCSFIEFRCRKCGKDWKVRFADFLSRKSKCPNCSPNLNRYTKEEREQQITDIIRNEKLPYTYNGMVTPYEQKLAYTKISLYCNSCKCGWKVAINDFVNQSHRCPHCNKSKGEARIAKILDAHKIKYEREYRFDDCKYKYRLPFDFYLYENNICIEFDGIHHFKPTTFASKDDKNLIKRFEVGKIKDEIRNRYCLKHKITLIRFKYDVTDEEMETQILNAINFKEVKCEEILKTQSTTLYK